jgi:hypothetical protein
LIYIAQKSEQRKNIRMRAATSVCADAIQPKRAIHDWDRANAPA